MSEIEHLKVQARRAEANGDYDRAVELYLRATREERTSGSLPNPNLILRVGDLKYRLDDKQAALEYYRDAVSLYTELGLITNAIAVCNKGLRVFPEEDSFRSDLVQLHLDVGLTAEARKHLLEVLSRARESGDAGRIVSELRAFLRRSPDEEVAVLLADRLAEDDREDEALEALESVWQRLDRAGASVSALEERARQIDPDLDFEDWILEEDEEDEDEDDEATVPGRGAGDLAPLPAAADGLGPPDDGRAAFRLESSESEDDSGDLAEDELTLGSLFAASREGEEADANDLFRQWSVARPEALRALTDAETSPPPITQLLNAFDMVARRRKPRPGGPAAGPGTLDPEAMPEGTEPGDGSDPALDRAMALADGLLGLSTDAGEVARRRLERARELDDRAAAAEALMDLAEVRLEEGDLRAARLACLEARSLAPESGRASSLWSRLAKDELEQTVQRGREALEEEGEPSEDDLERRRRLGWALWDEFEAALRALPWLHAATELYRSGGGRRAPAEVYELLGGYLNAVGRPRDAVTVLEEALVEVDVELPKLEDLMMVEDEPEAEAAADDEEPEAEDEEEVEASADDDAPMRTLDLSDVEVVEDPTASRVLFRLGLLHRRLGDEERARLCLTMAGQEEAVEGGRAASA